MEMEKNDCEDGNLQHYAFTVTVLVANIKCNGHHNDIKI